MTPEKIKESILQGMQCAEIQVTGDGRHFEALIVSEEFAGKSRLQRQQRVYQVLGNSMRDEMIHALTMKTFTPQEWQERT